MPVDFASIHGQVKKWGENAPRIAETLQQHRQEAQQCLAENAARLDELSSRVERAASENPGLRCAAPFVEPLNARLPLPPIPAQVTVLAADGSQINPDRHARVEFCVINVGAFEMSPG